MCTFQEVKHISFAANLFLFTKVNFIEWCNKIYELVIHGWADFVMKSVTLLYTQATYNDVLIAWNIN